MGKWQTSTPTTSTKISASYDLFTANWDALQEWSIVDHYGLTEALSGRHKPGASIWFADTTANINALASPVACAAAIDITLNSLKYHNGATWIDLGGAVPSGTKMLFYNFSAPLGWTVVTTATITGTSVIITQGGAGVGGTAHATGTWTYPSHTHTSTGIALTQDTIATHTHVTQTGRGFIGGTYAYTTTVADRIAPQISAGVSLTVSLPVEGGNNTHTSTYGSEIDAAGLATWRPAAYCCILCQKD